MISCALLEKIDIGTLRTIGKNVVLVSCALLESYRSKRDYNHTCAILVKLSPGEITLMKLCLNEKEMKTERVFVMRVRILDI